MQITLYDSIFMGLYFSLAARTVVGKETLIIFSNRSMSSCYISESVMTLRSNSGCNTQVKT